MCTKNVQFVYSNALSVSEKCSTYIGKMFIVCLKEVNMYLKNEKKQNKEIEERGKIENNR